MPFQVACTVSIHKAQGLECDSVEIVITDANKSDITHSIFYTAVTRARESLKVFWTPGTQQAVLTSLQRCTRPKDAALLSSRRGPHARGRNTTCAMSHRRGEAEMGMRGQAPGAGRE